MTKKDYIIIADVLRKQFNPNVGITQRAKTMLVKHLSVEFWKDNKRFDEMKFAKAILTEKDMQHYIEAYPSVKNL